MYTRQQSSQLKEAFWTAFGQYIALHASSEGMKINWLNYKTGQKYVYFRMHADKNTAYMAIELTHPDPDMQQLYFEQFFQLKPMLLQALGEEWHWELHTRNEHGKLISKIYKELPSVNVYNKENWPELISFFKPRMIALDEFWNSAKYYFEVLR